MRRVARPRLRARLARDAASRCAAFPDAQSPARGTSRSRSRPRCSAVSPLSVLSRGYAIAFSRTKRDDASRSSTRGVVAVGEPIEVQLKRGRLDCTVDAKTLGRGEPSWPESSHD